MKLLKKVTKTANSKTRLKKFSANIRNRKWQTRERRGLLVHHNEILMIYLHILYIASNGRNLIVRWDILVEGTINCLTFQLDKLKEISLLLKLADIFRDVISHKLMNGDHRSP